MRAHMRSVWCTIWLLGALLVIAMLDNLPDPPAANPTTARFEASCLHQDTAGSATPADTSSGTSFRLSVCFAVTDAFESHPRNSRLALTEHAADPSPPAQQS